MGPFAMALRVALLCIPLAAPLRSGERLEGLTSDAIGDECDEEAMQTRRLLQELGFTGPLNQSHCDLPGITCAWKSCRVETLECATCSGQLPERIHLKHLKKVSLTSPTLSGDIKSFEGTQLEELEMKGKAFGDIQVFQKMKNLNWLSLANTKVTGELQALEKLKFLHHLSLTDTHVVGNLSSLAGARRSRLELSGTGVTGNLSDLIGHLWESGASQHMSELNVLKLSRTKVTGHLGDLTPCRNLQELDVSYTQVFGRIQKRWRGCFQNLHILQLRNSSVQFVPNEEDLKSFREQRSFDRSLRSLQDLDLTHCPVNDSLENLLVVLVASSVTSIKAVGAGISGAVPRVKDLQVTIDGEALLSFEAFRKLTFLDLSQNNLMELRDLPVQPNVGRMLLRENPQIKVAPGTLAKALKERVILDLSGTKLSNQEEALQLLEEGQLTTTDMYGYRDESAGYACKDLTGTVMKVTLSKFLPEKLCMCLPGWHGHGATCHMCPADKFSDELGLDTCKSCPANSTAPEGSTKLANCKCDFGDLHNGKCSCDKHQTLRDGNCILCSKLHLQCETAGVSASSALPDVHYARLEPQAEEARRCLPPDVSQRCPGSHHCGLGYSGTLCATCANGFRAKGGRCKPCAKASSASMWLIIWLGVAALLLAILLIYRRARGHQVPQPDTARSQLKRLMVLQAPGLLQMVQLWVVLSQLRPVIQSTSSLPEIPYLEDLQLTINDIQNFFSLECAFNAETVRTAAALASPLLPLLLLACSAALELCHAGRGVNVLLKVLPFLFIGGAYTTANLLSCQLEDGDGESLGTFAFRKALPQLHCYDRSGVGFWVDVVGYSSALAYGILIPFFLAALMMQQHFALQHAHLFYARVEGDPRDITLRLEMLQGHMPQEAFPKRLLAAAAAYMAVQCRGKRLVRLHDGHITSTSSEKEDIEEVGGLSLVKVVAGAMTSKNLHVLKTCRLTKMLTERLMLDEAEDRLLIGSHSLLSKYTLSEDVWIYVVMRLYAVALVCCISMSEAWKWAIAFSLGMAVLIGVGQPYMWPQVSQLQSFSCVCLAVTSVAFAYDLAWLARLGLLAPLLLLLWQAQCPDCTESLAQRLYKELESELPKLQRGEAHALHVQQLRF